MAVHSCFVDLTESSFEESRLRGVRLFWSQLRALVTKRALHSRRNLTLTIAQVLVSDMLTVTVLPVCMECL